jgi:hypothetical protein
VRTISPAPRYESDEAMLDRIQVDLERIARTGAVDDHDTSVLMTHHGWLRWADFRKLDPALICNHLEWLRGIAPLGRAGILICENALRAVFGLAREDLMIRIERDRLVDLLDRLRGESAFFRANRLTPGAGSDILHDERK